MALDPYTPCPCGSGKKLKFCECAPDAAELEKVMIAIDGDQRVSALDQIDRLLATKPNQKAMLALKSIVQMQLGDIAGSKTTVDKFIAAAPSNPVALTLSALHDAGEERPAAAAVKVQKAIAASPQEIHYLVPDALLSIAQAFIYKDQLLAARAHVLLRLSLMGGEQEDRPGLSQLYRLNTSTSIPLALKQDFTLEKCQGEPAWKSDYDAAIDAAGHGDWLSAAQKLEAIDKKHPNQAQVLYSLAVFKTYLGDAQASALWHRYASLPDLPFEDALEAEITSQELREGGGVEQIARMRITYAVKDAARLLEILASDHRMSRMTDDPRSLVAEGTPPPRGAYFLLDRPTLDSSENLTLEAIPRVVGEVLLFGKETDREARLEFVVTKTADLASKVRQLQSVGAECLGMIEKEEKIDSVDAFNEALVARWRLPDGTPKDVRTRLVNEQFDRNAFDVMPKFPQPVFDGRSPREVAADPAYRLRLQAFLRVFELDYRQKMRSTDFNEVRRQLGLPALEPLDPTGVDMQSVSLLRLGRYDVSKLTGEQVGDILRRASGLQHAEPITSVAREALNRDGIRGIVEKCDAYALLSSFTDDNAAALELLQKAKQAAAEINRSPARFVLQEFDLYLASGNAEAASSTLQILQAKHMREPGIAEAIYMRLSQMGLIDPNDGSLRTPGGRPPAAAVPAQASGGLWSPEGPAPAAAASSGAKPNLWLPGMD